MKKVVILASCILAVVAFTSCNKQTAALASGEKVYADGTYRGGYIDPKQIEIDVIMKDGKFTEFRFRSMVYKNEDYLKSEDPVLQGIAGQYKELTDYLVGKDVSALSALYKPQDVAKDTDAVTAATLRSAKLISAINDALNRGLYALPK